MKERHSKVVAKVELQVDLAPNWHRIDEIQPQIEYNPIIFLLNNKLADEQEVVVLQNLKLMIIW